MSETGRGTPPRRARGRPSRQGTPSKEWQDYAIHQAVLAALAVIVRTDAGGLGRPIAAPGGSDNLRKAFRDVARLFRDLGHPIAQGTIKATWYRRERERLPPEAPTESCDRGVPLAYRVAARILSVQGTAVSPFDVLDWWTRSYVDRAGPLHPFDIAREYQREMCPIKSRFTE